MYYIVLAGYPILHIAHLNEILYLVDHFSKELIVCSYKENRIRYSF